MIYNGPGADGLLPACAPVSRFVEVYLPDNFLTFGARHESRGC